MSLIHKQVGSLAGSQSESVYEKSPSLSDDLSFLKSLAPWWSTFTLSRTWDMTRTKLKCTRYQQKQNESRVVAFLSRTCKCNESFFLSLFTFWWTKPNYRSYRESELCLNRKKNPLAGELQDWPWESDWKQRPGQELQPWTLRMDFRSKGSLPSWFHADLGKLPGDRLILPHFSRSVPARWKCSANWQGTKSYFWGGPLFPP